MSETSPACLAVIPARGGSKRVPGKNVRVMKGRPLIAYTVDAALESGLFERIVVSTDSPEIARVASDCGAEVPFIRDASLADDHTPVSAVTLDVLRRLDPRGGAFGLVCQLMANCPMRTAKDIVASYEAVRAADAESQLSVTRFGWLNPWWAFRLGQGNVLEPVFEDAVTQRSQDLPPVFCPTGAVWWVKANVLRREGTFHIPGRIGFELDWRHAVDIDTSEDWEMAELLMEMRSSRGGDES